MFKTHTEGEFPFRRVERWDEKMRKADELWQQNRWVPLLWSVSMETPANQTSQMMFESVRY